MDEEMLYVILLSVVRNLKDIGFNIKKNYKNL